MRFAALMLLVGCSSPGIAVEDFPTQAAKTVCKKLYGCCTGAEAMSTNFGPDQTGCEATVKKSVLYPDDVKRGSSAGRLVYHADKAADCLKDYEALSCEQLKDDTMSKLASCDGMTEAKVAVGSACSGDSECQGSTCKGESGTVDGVCEAFLTESSGCIDGGICGGGMFCDGASKACTRTRSDGATCNANYECTTGGCNGKDAGTPGTCGLKGGGGTTCYATTGCSAAGQSTGWISVMLLALALAAARRTLRSR